VLLSFDPQLLICFSQSFADLRDRAWGALYLLMKTSSKHRSFIISGMARSLLQFPDLKPLILISVMQKLKKLISYWAYLITDPNESHEVLPSPKAFEPITCEIEAVCLFFLCNPDAKVRELALDILYSIRVLTNLFEDLAPGANPDGSILRPTRIMDIIEESGSDVVDKLHNDLRFIIDVSKPFSTKNIFNETPLPKPKNVHDISKYGNHLPFLFLVAWFIVFYKNNHI
jgi:hypothetical protein